MSYQKTIVVGHLGQDSKIQQHNGKSVINFSVAVSKSYTNSEGVKVENATWFSCSLWEKEKLAAYLKKGTMVLVEGEISAAAYVNSQGEMKSELKLNVYGLKLLSSPKKKTSLAAPVSEQKKENQKTELEPNTNDSNNDLPF